MHSIIDQLEQVVGLLSAKEVAEILGVSGPTVYRLAVKKDLPGIRVGAKWVFDAKTLSYWVRKQHPSFAKAEREPA